MGFAQDVNEVREKISVLEKVSANFTPTTLDAIKKLAQVDFSNTDELIGAARKLQESSKDIKQVIRGLDDIKATVAIQNEISNVSDARDLVGLIVGALPTLRNVEKDIEVMNHVFVNQPYYQKIMEMDDNIKTAIFMKEDFDEVAHIAETLRDEILKAEILEEKVQKKLNRAEAILAQAINAEKRMDAKIKYIDEITDRMHNFSVNVDFVSAGKRGLSRYSPTNNELKLEIPIGKTGGPGRQGKPGVQGKPGIPGTATNEGKQGIPGKDGKNFRIDLIGNMRDMKKYGNRVTGTSFLSLDETPTMIYFKRSDTIDDWTDGQAFGISDGEDANITVTDSERLGGFTLEQIYKHIEKAFERINDG